MQSNRYLFHVIFATLLLILFSCPMPNDPPKPKPVTPVFTISYDANVSIDLEVPIDETKYEEGQEVVVKTMISGYPGYDFAGWSLSSEGSEPLYSAGDTFIMPAANQTFYAVWTLKSYSVTYHKNDDSNESEVQLFDYNTAFKVRGNSFNRTGYEFVEWNSEALGGGIAYAAGDELQRTESLNLYAQWKKIAFTLSFDANGGNGTRITIPYNSTISTTVPANSFSNTGMSFTGWNTDPNGNGIAYQAGDTINAKLEDVVLYAQWSINSYSLTYHQNDAVSQIESYKYQSRVTIKTNTFALIGRDFIGWNTDPEGNGISYSAGDTFDMPAQAVTLYALWKKKSYNLTYDGNGASIVRNIADSVEFEGSVTVQNPDMVNEHYAFVEWNTAANGLSTAYKPGDVFSMNQEGAVLYAIWQPVNYNLQLDANGGSGSIKNITVAYGDTISIPENTFIRKGYSFSHWNSNPGDTEKKYTAADDFTMNIAGDTLYAIWKPNAYTVTFNANNGTSQTSSDSIYFDTYFSTRPANHFEKSGYDFDSWNTLQDGNGQSYAENTSVQLTEEGLTLFAQWKVKTYSLSFDADGGSGSMTPLSLTYGQNYTVPECTFSKIGYTFIAWYTGPDSTGDLIPVGSSHTYNWASNHTLYAGWKANTYNVNLHGNGGVGTMAARSVDFGSDITLDTNTFTRIGYSFAGWSTASGSSTIAYRDAATFTMGPDHLDLYAVWTPKSYALRYDSNGADTNSTADTIILYGQKGSVRGSSQISRTDYRFVEWNTSSTGSGRAYKSGDLYEMNSEGAVLYAIWEEIVYEIVFDANGGSGAQASLFSTRNKNVNIPDCTLTPKTGYSFAYWTEAQDGSGIQYSKGDSYRLSSQGTTLYAQWTANTYDLNLHSNFGSGSISKSAVVFNQSVNLTSAVFSRIGYTLSGWTENSDGSEKLYAADAVYEMKTEGADLYAVWTANTYTVTFYANNGSSESVQQTFTYDQPAQLRSISFTKKGHSFTRWNTQVNGYGTTYLDTAMYTPADSNIELYALWQPESYQLIFDSNYGSSNTTSPRTITFGNSTRIPYHSGFRSYYTFTEWNTKADGSGTAYKQGDDYFMNEEGATLFAIWTPNEYDLVLDTNGAPGSDIKLKVSYGNSVNIPENTFVYSGYTFLNWEDSTGHPYNELDTITMNTDGIRLYANWQANNYDITFHSNFGTNQTKTQTYTYGTYGYLDDNTWTRTGHSFLEWRTNPDGSGDRYIDSQGLVLKLLNKDLYAQWAKNTYSVSFDSNWGTGSMDDMFALYQADVTVPANGFTYDKYIFDSWNTAKDGSGRRYEPGDALTLADANVTLYAQWIGVPVTVSFDVNGGIGTIPPIASRYRERIELGSLPAVSMPIHKLVQWNTKADGTGERTWPSSTYYVPSEDITLFAIWELIDVDVRIYYGANASFPYDVLTAKANESVILPNGPGPQGPSSFSFYDTQPDGLGTSYLPGDTYFLGTEDSKLYIMSEKDPYNLYLDGTLHSNIPSGRKISVPKPAGNADFIYWRNRDTQEIYRPNGDGNSIFLMPEADTYLESVSAGDTFKIVIMENGGSITAPEVTGLQNQSVTIPSVSGADRTGYTFAGFNTKADGTGTSYQAGDNLTFSDMNIVLYAQWTPNTYTLTFYLRDKNNTTITRTGEYGTDFETSSLPISRPGFTLIGWANDSDDLYVHMTAGTSVYVNGNRNVYACWRYDYPKSVEYAAGNPNSFVLKSTPFSGSQSIPLEVDDSGQKRLDAFERYMSEAPRTFLAGEKEVSYALWKEVYDWAVSQPYSTRYTFANPGVQSGATPDTPVVGITYYDAAIWMNALTEWHNKTFNTNYNCFYTRFDPLRDSRSSAWSKFDPWYYENDGDGFRLPSHAEWSAVARFRTDAVNSLSMSGYNFTKGDSASGADSNSPSEAAKYAVFSGASAVSPGTKLSNDCGIYDMSGNVSEWVMQFNSPNNEMFVMGGSHADVMPIGQAVVTTADTARNDLGFRIFQGINFNYIEP